MRVTNPLRRLAGLQARGHGCVRQALHGAWPIEVRGADDQALQLAALDLVLEGGRDSCPHLALPAARVVRRVFGHDTVHLAVGVDVVEEHERAAVAFAGVDGVAHDRRPLLPPHPMVVFEAGNEVAHAASRDRARRGPGIQQVGGEQVVRRVHWPR